ncbi:hypothetical protein PCCS19_28910 [Paenibacillus sp. CCS19]|uniref:hypothetical protein n=1 Tax=Paenibacillus sp. CCS19 TaxID=3158387 RepID=UPI0025660F05|nr:hypothetical protein [Paenibacillus cellulosilyticus]GMK39836.1 hypothetical protein PCCS19_28910 [Paenibacillus cellulosilyticus]
MIRSLFKFRLEVLLSFSLLLLLTACTSSSNETVPTTTEEQTPVNTEETNKQSDSDVPPTQPAAPVAEPTEPSAQSIAAAASAKEAIAILEAQLPALEPAQADQLFIELESFYRDHDQQFAEQFIAEPYFSSLEQLAGPISEEDLANLPEPAHTLVADAIAGKYRLVESEGIVYPIVDYRALLDYAPYLSEAMRDYLKLMAEESDDPSMKDAAVSIPWEELSKRTLAAETYLDTYPDSPRHMNVKGMLQRNLVVMLNGSSNTSVFENGFQLKSDVKAVLKQTATSSASTFTGQMAKQYLALIDEISANYSAQDQIDSNDPNYNRISQFIDSVMAHIETEM